MTCGIDWACDDHAVAIIDNRGMLVHRSAVEYRVAGLREMVAVLGRAGAAEVAIERPDGPVVDALLGAGIAVVVISPNRLKNLRGRYGAGNKDDRFDAFVLADTLRTERARLRPLVPDTEATVALRAHVHITRALVGALNSLVEQFKLLCEQIGEQLTAHADAHIFTSLPRSGTIRAGRLLVEIGDCRARFPNPETLACLAGVAPSTRQSGKMRAVGFCWACDNELRDAVTDFAADSRHANPWAADLYDRAIARGHDHPHAVRILARACLYIIWHCWQDQAAYEPTKHRALQTMLKQQQQPAV